MFHALLHSLGAIFAVHARGELGPRVRLDYLYNREAHSQHVGEHHPQHQLDQNLHVLILVLHIGRFPETLALLQLQKDLRSPKDGETGYYGRSEQIVERYDRISPSIGAYEKGILEILVQSQGDVLGRAGAAKDSALDHHLHPTELGVLQQANPLVKISNEQQRENVLEVYRRVGNGAHYRGSFHSQADNPLWLAII